MATVYWSSFRLRLWCAHTEEQIRRTVTEFGPGTAFYLNGDELGRSRDLVEAIRTLLPLFSNRAPLRRLFIDEITAIDDWETGLKRLFDSGELREVLMVTTGSKAADLRHGSERLPGRKGRLDRTAYLFAPISYAEFHRVCGRGLGSDTLPAYLLSGGSPLACAELAANRRLPEYAIEITRDWIFGECAASGRSRAALLGVFECLHRFGGTPVGQAKLAREAGLANNTVAAGHEIDFIATPQAAVEVKLGSTNPMEFAWFPRTFTRASLTVIGNDRWQAGSLEGMTLEDFLLADRLGTIAE